MRRAGYQVTEHGAGTSVVVVLPHTPATGVLKANDLILAVNGQLTPLGFTFKGSTFTSPGGAGYVCATAGTYRIHLAGKHLTLTVIHDTCKIGRAQVFPGHIWTKVG